MAEASKRWIVGFALAGWIPFAIAEALIRWCDCRGGDCGGDIHSDPFRCV